MISEHQRFRAFSLWGYELRPSKFSNLGESTDVQALALQALMSLRIFLSVTKSLPRGFRVEPSAQGI
jgi:hypothetical protein